MRLFPTTRNSANRCPPANILRQGLDKEIIHPDIVVFGCNHINITIRAVWAVPWPLRLCWFRTPQQHQDREADNPAFDTHSRLHLVTNLVGMNSPTITLCGPERV